MSQHLPTLVKSLASTAKLAAKDRALRLLSTLSKLRGAHCLTRDETISFCASLGHDYSAGVPTTFELGAGIQHLEVMRCGIVRINRRECLYTDFGNRAATIDFASPKRHEEHVIALWSHATWLGFHHFLAEVTPKICRLMEEYGKDLGGAKLCFPMIHRRYEKELLGMLGIRENQVIDCKAVGGVIAKQVTIVPMAGWFRGNPNVELLRKYLMPPAKAKSPDLLYLGRMGRRRCLNDGAIIERCLELGFTVVDESSRTIPEQIELYRDAKVLVGPHGSAFTNMVWAAPGARIVEMIPSTFDVEYHEHLAASLGHHHTKIACANGPRATSGVTIDFTADVRLVIETIEREVKVAPTSP
jgi:Glycosyltransferase 61